MAELSELVTVSKPGEPKLKIRRETLAEHQKLGWAQAAEEPAPSADKPDSKLTLKK